MTEAQQKDIRYLLASQDITPAQRRAIKAAMDERAELLAACEAYRAQHDRLKWEHIQPCTCDECAAASAAISKTKEQP